MFGEGICGDKKGNVQLSIHVLFFLTLEFSETMLHGLSFVE